LNAAAWGWDFAASYGEVLGALHSSAYINGNRDTKAHPKPIELPFPWTSAPEPEVATVDEVEAARAYLRSKTAFAN
jgi:hypothetical protein